MSLDIWSHQSPCKPSSCTTFKLILTGAELPQAKKSYIYVPDTPKNRGLQAREPSKCLNGQSYGESLAKEAF